MKLKRMSKKKNEKVKKKNEKMKQEQQQKIMSNSKKPCNASTETQTQRKE